MNKQKLVISIVVFIFVIFIFSSACMSDEAELLTPEQMRENLTFIRDKIIQTHPNPYHSISNQEYQILYGRLMNKLNEPLRADVFYFIANEIIAVLKDAHTTLGYGYETKYIPITGELMPDGFGIYSTDEDHSELLHVRLIAIENIPVEGWLTEFAKLWSHENMEYIQAGFSSLIRSQLYVGHILGNPDIEKVRITVEKNQKVFDATLAFDDEKPLNVIDIGTAKKPAAEKQGLYLIRWLDNISAGYISFFSCPEDEDFFHVMNSFIDETNKRGYHNLVFDVRYNGGGSMAIIDEVLNHLPGDKFKGYSGYSKLSPEEERLTKYGGFKKKQESAECPVIVKKKKNKNIDNMFTGKIYVLIGRNTFSSGNAFPIMLKDNGLATLVGQRTSNAPCAFGAFKHFELPHGRFTLNVSSKFLIRPSCVCDSDSLIPDVQIPVTMNDYVNNRDPVMEWLEKNLK